MKRSTLFAVMGAAVLLIVTILAIMFLPKGGGDTKPGMNASENSPAEAKVRAELVDVQRQFQAAVRGRDEGAVVALMTSDFTQRFADGRVINRKQAEAEMKATWPSIVSIDEWELEIVDLKVNGDVAVGKVREKIVATLKDKQGERSPATIDSRSRNTWIRTASGWKYKRMEELPKEETLEGVEYVSSDQWQRETQARRSADRSQANRDKDRAAAVQGDAPISKAEARRMLDKVYAKFRADVRRKDAKAALSSLTDDYVVEYPTHNEARGAVERSMKGDLKATESIPEWNLTIRDITVDGNTITALLEDRKTAVYRGPDGSRFRGRVEATMKDTWVKTREGWKNRRTEMIRIRAYRDGKLVQQMG